MASKRKNQYSVCVIKELREVKRPVEGMPKTRLITIGYLSNRDIEQGLDIQLDLNGYIIEAL